MGSRVGVVVVGGGDSFVTLLITVQCPESYSELERERKEYVCV